MPRVPVEYRTSSKDVYKRFCKEHPDIALSFEDWKEIIYSYNYSFRDYILDTGERVKLPCGLGTFSINAKKTKKFRTYEGKEYVNLPIDWKKTRELGKTVYHLNNNTDGKKFKWVWFIEDAVFYMAEIWMFKPSRVSSRKINEQVQKNSSECVEKYKKWNRR